MPQVRKWTIKMAHAIMEWEGYWKDSASYRNNNPGNVKAAGQPGVIGKDSQGHAQFADFQAGWDALIYQLTIIFDGRSRVYNSDMTFYEVFAKYAEANSRRYAEFVAARLQVPPTTKLKELA